MTTAVVAGSRALKPTVLQLSTLAFNVGYHGVDRLLVGCCTGVDQAVARYFATTDIPVYGYPAYYSQLEWARSARDEGILAGYTFPRQVSEASRNLAGPIRNALMAKEAAGGILFAFPGGRGTESMKRQARKWGLRVFAWNGERFVDEEEA